MIGATYSQAVYKEYGKTHDSDLFEKIIDDLMIERYSDDPATTKHIYSLSPSLKRIAILSLLSEDNYDWDILRKKIRGNKVSKYKHLTEIIEDLRIFAKLGKVNKKTQGEVMTPIEELAKPMIKLIEKYDDSFWEDPTNKVLDSSAGIGTFLILSLIKFWYGLKEWEPDEEKRYKHIVENCLYYGELRSRNVFLWLCLIDPYNEYKTNTYWGSFLDDGDKKPFDVHMDLVWKIEKFEAIIQNPPFQIVKENNTRSHTLWNAFVEKSLTLLKEDKYMVMVHPGAWRNVESDFKDIQRLLRSKQILELHIHSQNDGVKLFGVETTYDYYILKNTDNYTTTNIKLQSGGFENVNISKMEFIPNGMFKFIESLLSTDNNVSIIGDSSYHTQREHLSKTKDSIYKYPCIYTIAKGDILKLWYSNVNDKGHFGIPKLVWSNGRIKSVGTFVDEKGDYGVTQFSYAIIDSVENLKSMKIAFDSKKFRDAMEFCSMGVMAINRKIIGTFKKDFWKEFID